jgi:hypothetical protein
MKSKTTFRKVWDLLQIGRWSRKRGLPMGLQTVISFGIDSWAPAFYMRAFGWTAAEDGLVQYLIIITALPLGAFAGSMPAERFARNDSDDANMRVAFLVKVVSLPASILFPLMPNAARLLQSRHEGSIVCPGLWDR